MDICQSLFKRSYQCIYKYFLRFIYFYTFISIYRIYKCCYNIMLCTACVPKFPNNTARIEDGRFIYTPHRIGNSILMYGRRSSYFPYQMLIGPQWPCMLFTYALIIVPTVLFFKNIAVHWGPGCIVGGVFTFVLLLRYDHVSSTLIIMRRLTFLSFAGELCDTKPLFIL